MRMWLAKLGIMALAAVVVADLGRDLAGAWAASLYAAHGPLVCLFSAYAAWSLRTGLPPARWRADLPAVAPGCLALAALVAGHATDSLSLRALAVPALALTAALLAYGPPGARALAFPLAFLVAAVPLPAGWVVALSAVAQHAAASVAHRTLDVLGIPVVRDGLNLQIGRVSLAVTEACNGLRFLLTSVLVGIAVAWALRCGLRERGLIVALATAGGIVANLVRVTGTAVLASVEPAAVIGTPHVVFGKVVYLMVGGAVAVAVTAVLRRPLRVSKMSG